MSTLAHVVEMLPYWAHQAEAVVAHPGERFGRTHHDPDRISAVEQHGRDSLEAMLPRIRASLDECLRSLRAIPEDRWSTTAEHPSRGTMSVAQLVDAFLVNHAQEHVAQIRSTLDALAARP